MGPPQESRTSWVAQRLVLPEQEDEPAKLRSIALDPLTRKKAPRVRNRQPWNNRFTHGSPVATQNRRWPDASAQFTPIDPIRLPFSEPFAWTRPGVAHQAFVSAMFEDDDMPLP